MKICEYELCSGCSLCASVCPRNAVTMTPDKEGFLRPVVDSEKCVECGLCEKKCPVNGIIKNSPLSAYAAYSRDPSIRKSSSSGGIFYTVASPFIKEGGVVCGAGYSDGLSVIHKFAETEEELKALMGSKYVQSNMNGVPEKLKSYLDNGRKVLFAGTPCQCAAVRNYVGNYENLFIVDFICHGVPTPKLWEKFISEEFPDAVGASFRDKKLGWQEFSMRVDTDKGVYRCSQYKDPYMRMFLKNIVLRPSCYKCSWKGDNYSSDMTFADFWGISKIYPEMNDDKGVSSVVIRSEKGQELFDKIKDSLVCKKTEVKTVQGTNIAFDKSAEKPTLREEFFEDLSKDKSFKELSAKYAKPVSAVEIAKIRVKRTAKKLLCKVYKLKK